MDEMSLAGQLHPVYLQADIDVRLASVELILLDSVISLRPADLLQW